MAITLYEKTSGALVPSGERTVATYVSGLVRVDQTYICSHDAAATHRAALVIGAAMPDGDTTPAIDGLYIFPTPQEIRKPDGFTEFRVSAYGRVTAALQNISSEHREYSAGDMAFKLKVITGSIVVPAGTTITSDVVGLAADSFDPFDFIYQSSYAWLVAVTDISDYRTVLLRAQVVNSVDGNTSTDEVTINVRARSFTFLNDGVDENGFYDTGSIIFLDPVWKIKAQRNFGKFSEVDIESDISSPAVLSEFTTLEY